MESAADPRLGDFIGPVLDARPFAFDPGSSRTRHCNDRNEPLAKFGLEDGCCSGRSNAMGAGVLRMKRRINQRLPIGLADGGIVAVDVSVAYRGDGPPEVERVLGVEDCN